MKSQESNADLPTAIEPSKVPIGIGLGASGLVVQKLADDGLTSAAVLISSVPPAGIEWKCATTAISDMRRDSILFREREVQPDRADLDDLVYNRMPKDLADKVFAKQVPESGWVLAQLLNHEIAVNERRVTCPVLSIVMGDDRLVLSKTGLAVAAKYGALSAEPTQRSLGIRLHKPYSFVWKVEAGERRIDPIEFIAWCNACDKLPADAITALDR